ncbi:MAG: bifunctional sugar-1-phosphate nucleotidylyltransferase/acetyltransferase [Candidatus Hydrothermarchaeota archaeon]
MKVVILAAGEGTRLRPLTLTSPKVLLPLANKPLLKHVIERTKEREIILVVNYMKDKIKEFFENNDYEIVFIEQGDTLGTAHAISCVEKFIDEDFIAINGDIVYDQSLKDDIVSFHFKNNSKATLAVKKIRNCSNYGVIKLEGYKVKNVVEKPEKTENMEYVNLGFYVFDPIIFDYIKKTKTSKRGEYEITDSIQLMLSEEDVFAFPYEGTWIDIGRPWDLLTANQYFLSDLKRELGGECENNAKIIGNVKIGKGTKVRSGSYIEGPAIIGNHCDIGPNCYIRKGTSIGDYVRIGNAVEIKNSIIMEGTRIGHLTYVGDSIVGRECNFGAGTLVGNLRLDEKNVFVTIKGEKVDSGRRKLGAIIGDRVKTGLNVTINPGVTIGHNSFIYPGVNLMEDLPPNSIIYAEQKIVKKRKK